MIKFLIKGLLRDRSRSLFPILIIVAGTLLTVFLYSFFIGIMNDTITANAKFDTGYVKIMTRAYKGLASQAPNDLALLGINDLLKQLKHLDTKLYWAPRIHFGGLLDIPDKKGETRAQGPVIGLAVDLLGTNSMETNILTLRKALVSGHIPQKKNEILISDEYAKRLGVGPGDTATLISSTMDGDMAIYNFKIAGTIRFGVIALDRTMIISDLADTQNALDMEDGASEIAGFSMDNIYNDEKMEQLKNLFNQKFTKASDQYSPVMVKLSEQNGLEELISLVGKVRDIIIFVFILVMSIVLWNSGLLNGLRRYGEIGIRLAMGEPKSILYRRMIFESFVIGIIGTIFGTFLGLAISFYFQFHPIDMGSIMKNSSLIMNSLLRAQVTIHSYYIGFLPGLIAPVLGTMFAGFGIYQRQTSQLFKELEA